MDNGVSSLYEFEGYRLDPVSGTLWRGSGIVPLSPKAIEVLKLLLEHEGEIVSKQEIFDRVWADTFVEDGVLTQNIYTLRNALGRDEKGRQFIETVPRRGYRIAAAVKKEQPETQEVMHAAASPQVGSELLASASEHASRSAHETDTYSRRIEDSTEVRARRHLPVYLLVAGLAVLTAAVFGIYLFTRKAPEVVRFSVAPIEQLKFQKVTDSGDVVYPTLSPDGTLLAYVRLEDEEASVWVKQMPDGDPVQTLPMSRKGYRSLGFSPDSKLLYFREESESGAIYQAPVLGGAPKKIADNVWSDFSVSPNGKQIAFIRRDDGLTEYLLIIANTDGTGERRLASRTSPMDFRGGSPGWAPSGEKITIASGQQQQFFPKLVVIDVKSGSEIELKTPRWRSIYRALWLPDGERMIVTARDANERYSQIWMLSAPDGEVRRLTNDLESYFWLSMSPDGRSLITRQQRIVSHLWQLPGGDIADARQLTAGERALDGYVGLAWAPDRRIIFSSFVNNVTDLFMLDSENGRVQLTADAGPDNTDPAVTRDGGTVYFTSNRTGSPQIWRMDIHGRGQQQMTGEGDKKLRAVSASVSPDGREIYFIGLGVGPAAVWKIPARGGEPIKVSNLTDATAETFVSISPDGKLLAYRHVSNRQESESEERTTQIGVMSADGRGEPRIFDLSMRKPMVQWTPDSTGFYYAAGTFNSSALMLQPVNGGPPQKVLELPDRIFNFAWSLDGKDLAIARGRLLGDAILISNLP